MEYKNLEEFAAQFFTMLKATVEKEGQYLRVINTPAGFQKFYGKKEPYLINFDKANETENTELLAPGSYLLRVMSDYLEARGETTMLWLVPQFDYEKIMNEKINLLNSKWSHMSKKEITKNMIRFTFQTSFNYLNKQDKITSELFIDETGEIIEPSINWTFMEGKKREVTIENLRALYTKAKEEVRRVIEPKLNEKAASLQKSLVKEMERIQTHYKNQRGEIEANLVKSREQLYELINTDKDIKNREQRIAKLREIIAKNENTQELEKIKKEEEVFIKNETKKHGLNVSTKLINTSIIIYPIYTIQSFIKSNISERIILFEGDTLRQTLSKVFCEGCKNEINRVVLCNGNHILCEQCAALCEDCKQVSCNMCLKKCSVTLRQICKQCAGTCRKCMQTKNKRFMRINETSKEIRCVECWNYCTSCSKPMGDNESALSAICTNCHYKQKSASAMMNIKRDW